MDELNKLIVEFMKSLQDLMNTTTDSSLKTRIAIMILDMNNSVLSRKINE